MRKIIILSFVLIALTISRSFGQMPRIIKRDGRHALLVDEKPFLILGGQAHNSSGWPGMLPVVWAGIEAMHANTLEVPIYWEQVEPEQGKFDFSLMDTLLIGATQHNVHLVLLWFATWKNGSNHYMPGWMKSDARKYPNVTGKNGKPIDSPSPLYKATLDADKKAFAAVMKYLKNADTQHTVIMVQVENESGAWGSVRDYSATAQKLFEGAVPAQLLKPSVLRELNVAAGATGSWQKVFGDRADEYFHAWSVALFIGQVAAAGKAEYPLPMYVNAALRDPLTNPMANTYESGGPTDNVIPIWKVAAPAIDLLAPDIYISGSERILKVIDLYCRADNALFVPEAALSSDKVKYLYDVIAHGGIGFSPFGIDDNGKVTKDADLTKQLAPFTAEYAMAASMMRELAQWSFDGKIKTVTEHEDFADQTIDLGAWKAIVTFGGDGRANAAPVHAQPTGKMMIVQLEENTFILIGTGCHITFQPVGKNADKAWQYGKVEEGRYENGTFKLLRIQNGDETDWGGPGFGDMPSVLRTTLIVR
jgi:beta-galactosidase GanA